MRYDMKRKQKLVRFINITEARLPFAYRYACQEPNGAFNSRINYQKGPVFIYKPLYFIMGRKLKRCPKQCKKHGFLLKPVHYSAVFSRELSASFCPSSLRGPSITPKFNKDNRHFTISFILPSDYKKISGNEEYYRKEHEKQREENGNEKSKMYIPRPRAKGSYCSVCKADYDDYLEHIHELSHKRAIRQNRFNGFIDELSAEMQLKSREEEMHVQESKYIQFSDPNTLFFTQENTHFEEKTPLQPQNEYANNGFEYKQINQMFHSAKGFHPLCNHPPRESHSLGLEHEDFAREQLSPFLKPVANPEAGRVHSSLKPIIISGVLSQNLILH